MTSKLSLFVYGSFCENMIHSKRISDSVTERTPAIVKGSAYRLEVGYPVYLAEGEDQIEGELVELEASSIFFTLLDEFHGVNLQNPEKSLYWKKQTTVITNEGPKEAYVYCLNPAKLPKKATKIAGGDWRRSLTDNSVVTNNLTERQVDYIQKLGASSGRDIVPIDLNLYRELMSLEIIVDKGRRLALTKFGKEVYRYLS